MRRLVLISSMFALAALATPAEACPQGCSAKDYEGAAQGSRDVGPASSRDSGDRDRRDKARKWANRPGTERWGQHRDPYSDSGYSNGDPNDYNGGSYSGDTTGGGD